MRSTKMHKHKVTAVAVIESNCTSKEIREGAYLSFDGCQVKGKMTVKRLKEENEK